MMADADLRLRVSGGPRRRDLSGRRIDENAPALTIAASRRGQVEGQVLVVSVQQNESRRPVASSEPEAEAAANAVVPVDFCHLEAVRPPPAHIGRTVVADRVAMKKTRLAEQGISGANACQ